MALTHMKKWIFIFFTARLMVSGVELYIIIPTAWIYIRSFGQTEAFLALVLSAFSIGGMLFSAVLGLLSDRFRHPRTIMVVCHFLRLCGNAIYSVPVSEYYPLIGRFLCGVSAASDSVMLGEIARTTDGNERAKAFLLLHGAYSLGASLGPALAIALDFNVDIFGWKIDEGNSPGFAMALIWVVIVGITFFLPRNFRNNEELKKEESLAKDEKDIDEEEENFPENPSSASTRNKPCRSSQTDICPDPEERKLDAPDKIDDFSAREGLFEKLPNSIKGVPESSQSGTNKDLVVSDISGKKGFFEEVTLKAKREGLVGSSQMKKNEDPDELNESLSKDATDSCSEEDEDSLGKIPWKQRSVTLCLFYLIFTSWFFVCVATFYTPLLAMELLHLPSLHVKLLFLNGSLLLMLLCLVLYIAAEYCQERSLIKLSVYLQIIPIAALTTFALYWNDTPFYLSYFLIVYVCLGMPYFSYTLASSLLSKLCDAEEINFYQGLSISIIQCAAVSGRVIPSFMFTKITLGIFSVGLGVLWIIGLLWLCIVYELLVPDPSR